MGEFRALRVPMPIQARILMDARDKEKILRNVQFLLDHAIIGSNALPQGRKGSAHAQRVENYQLAQREIEQILSRDDRE